MERGCYFLRTLPPPPEDPRELPEEPRDAEPELPREDEPRDTLPDLPDEDEPREELPDLPDEDEPTRVPLEPLERPEEGLAYEPEEGREYGPVYVRALAAPPSP
jgi:hypothetical protein